MQTAWLQSSQYFWICLRPFQVAGQNSVTCLDAPLNKERPFCCRDSSLVLSGFKFGVPSLRVAGYNTLETSLVRSGANRGASGSAVQSEALSRCKELITGLYASLDIFSLLRPFSEGTGIPMFRGWRGFLILFSLLITFVSNEINAR